jgi:esterase/lipase
MVIKIDFKAQEINLNANSKKEFLLFHGYTGSPTDFNGLENYLHKRFNANVKIPLLLGHGRDVRDLDNLRYRDFLNQVEKIIEKELKEGKRIVVGGISFGGFLALHLASKYHVAGIFDVASPYMFSFPFNLPGIYKLRFFKKYWKKRGYEKMYSNYENAFYYKELHINGVQLSQDALVHFNHFSEHITAPCLLLHAKNDVLSSIKSVFLIENKIKSIIKKRVFFNGRLHNLFFSKDKNRVFRVIGNFFEYYDVFGSGHHISRRPKVWHKVRHNIKQVSSRLKSNKNEFMKKGKINFKIELE